MAKINNKLSYNFHNGFINKVTMTGIMEERIDNKQSSKIKVTNGDNCIEFISSFKLSWLKYKVGTYVTILARAIVSNGELTFEIKYISAVSLLTYPNTLEPCIALSGFIGCVSQANNNVGVVLLQNCKANGYDIIVEGANVISFYVGQALHLEGCIRNNVIISKLNTMYPASIGKNRHINQLPEWLKQGPFENKAVNPLIEKYKDWL